MKLLTIIAFVIILLCAAKLSEASDPFIQFGIGETFAIPKYEDGIWYDSFLPHEFHTKSLAYRVGLGLKFNKNWSATLSYANLGKNGVDSLAVSDACFAVKCSGETPSKFHVTDKVQGAELALIRTFQRDQVSPYLRGGVLLGVHNLHADVFLTEGSVHADMSGKFVAPFLSIGVRYKWAFAEVSYYRMMGGFRGDPVSTSFIVPMIGGRYEF